MNSPDGPEDKNAAQRNWVMKFALISIVAGVLTLVINVDIGVVLIGTGCVCIGAILFWFPPRDGDLGSHDAADE